ncbi:hypothetical protein ABW19_dt0209083 [Dactylella cylindrospora]|nr:hypothetical protein ABW19_dt0209083 [Dactylella cylindrospora]
MALPPGYMSIADARQKDKYTTSLIGIVVDAQHPTQSKGTDFVCTMEICDQSAALKESCYKIRMFKPPNQLPQELAVENIIVAREVKANQYMGSSLAISTKRTEWVVCKFTIPNHKNKRLPPPRPNIKVLEVGPDRAEDEAIKASRLSKAELEACKALAEFWVARGGLAGCFGVSQATYQQEHPVKANRGRKSALIKEVELDKFYDLIGYVQKTWYAQSSYTVTITDFTENPNLNPISYDPFQEVEATSRDETYSFAYEGGGVRRREGINSHWYEKPFGKYSLPVTIWDAFAAKARETIKEGQYVVLMNIRIKFSGSGRWEGSLNQARNDTKMKEGFRVLPPNDARVKELIARRNQLEKFLIEKKEREAKEAAAILEERRKAELEDEIKRRATLNPQIHLHYPSIKTTTIADISCIVDGTGADFNNRRYRTECRVTDFRPALLEDFCRPIGDDISACSLDLNVPLLDDEGNPKPRPEWYWCFEIDVVGLDSETYITIQVDDKAGRFLLNQEPCDLRAPENYNQRGQLTNNLWKLWGNLEEVKRNRREKLAALKQDCEQIKKQLEEGQDPNFIEKMYAKCYKQVMEIQSVGTVMDPKVSNKPFGCMIKEYGICDEEGFAERKFILEYTSVKPPPETEGEDGVEVPAEAGGSDQMALD